jgi:hypothetical protein
MALAADAPAAAPQTYVIYGQVVRLPVVVRDASSAFASFVVPSAAVRPLLPAGLQPAELLPGRTLCSIAGIEYRDNDLGRYNEVAVAFIAREGRAVAPPLIDLIRGHVGAYIHRLPVTEAFTCEAGSTIWGFPKTIEKISITEEGGRRICKLMMGGAHVLTLSVKSSGRWRVRESPVTAYSYRDGVVRRTPFVSGGEGVGYRLGGAALTLGAHPLADELRRLGLPKPALMSGSINRMHARFEAPQVVKSGGAK